MIPKFLIFCRKQSNFYLLFLVLLLTQISCREVDINSKWYEEIKSNILKDTLYDNSIIEKKDSSKIVTLNYYKKNKLLKTVFTYNLEYTVGETMFSSDNKFELRKEIYSNKQIAFEGLTYLGAFYGLSTWYYKNGQVKEQGTRFKNKKIGIWKKYKENGELLKIEDFKDNFLFDSLNNIKYNR